MGFPGFVSSTLASRIMYIYIEIYMSVLEIVRINLPKRLWAGNVWYCTLMQNYSIYRFLGVCF